MKTETTSYRIVLACDAKKDVDVNTKPIDPKR